MRNPLIILIVVALQICPLSSIAQFGQQINFGGNDGIFYDKEELKEIAKKMQESIYLSQINLQNEKIITDLKFQLKLKDQIIENYSKESISLQSSLNAQLKNSESFKIELLACRKKLKNQKKRVLVIAGCIFGGFLLLK